MFFYPSIIYSGFLEVTVCFDGLPSKEIREELKKEIDSQLDKVKQDLKRNSMKAE